jgi:predicted dehydrogenase
MFFHSRREFLRHSAALSAALAGLSQAPPETFAQEPKTAAKRGSANDRLRVAVIGVRGQGASHCLNYANGKHNTELAIICDVDEAVIGGPMATAEKLQKKRPQYVKDLRKVFDDKSIDLVSIATPNHWHALAAIWAMQAGKDVYVEKPVSHNVSEGRRIVEMARKLGKICQTGTQSRSMTGMRQAMEFLFSGKLGKVQISRGLCYKSRLSIGKVDGPQQPPKTMDYDLWCGPAPVKPPMRNTKYGTVHYDWHWIWDYGNGDLGNQGIHEMDKARWGLQKYELPRHVVSVGGRFGYVDDGETPNTQLCFFDYGDSQLVFEVRGLKTDALRNAKVGNIFHCEKGILVCPTYDSGVAYDLDGKKLAEFKGGSYADHFGNFVKAVRSRQHETLNADILEGHLSSALCHLGNLSYRLGKPQPFAVVPSTLGAAKDAADTIQRMVEHLKANGVDVNKTPCQVGRPLTLDPKTERFVNDKEADTMLTRQYRKGFEVPAKV